MLELKFIYQLVQVFATLLYFVLIVRLIRTGRTLYCPFFTLYVLLMILYLIWHPLKVIQAFWIQPWLLSLRLCAAVEAVLLLATNFEHKKTRYLIFMGLSLGGIPTFLFLRYFDISSPVTLYRSIDQTAHIALTFFCSSLILYSSMQAENWKRSERLHLILLTVHFTLFAAFSFYTDDTTLTNAARWEHFYTARITFLSLDSCLILCWIKWTMLKTRN